MMTRQQIIVGGCAAVAVAVALGSALSRERIPEVELIEGVYAALPGRVEVETLSFGETFGQILEDAGLGTAERVSVLDAFRDEAEPRRLRTGTEVRIHWVDEGLHGIQVALDRDRTVHVDCRAGDCAASTVTLATTIDTVYAAGVIESSLWTAVVELPELASAPMGDRRNFVLSLDRVFQWQIDFSRQILPGDTYRFVFEREKRPGRKHALRPASAGGRAGQPAATPIYAIWFDPNGDGAGHVVRPGGRVGAQGLPDAAASKFSRISSRYTNSRFHPILQGPGAATPGRGLRGRTAGTPDSRSTADGVVIRRRGWSATRTGASIDVRHPQRLPDPLRPPAGASPPPPCRRLARVARARPSATSA